MDRTPDRCSIAVRSGDLKRFIISFAENVYVNRWVVGSSVVRYSPALDGAYEHVPRQSSRDDVISVTVKRKLIVTHFTSDRVSFMCRVGRDAQGIFDSITVTINFDNENPTHP